MLTVCKRVVSVAASGVLVFTGATAIIGVQACAPNGFCGLEQAQAISAAKAKKVLKKKLKSIKKKVHSDAPNFDGIHYKFADMNKDGKVELFIHYGSGTWGQAVNEVYTAKSGKAKRIYHGDDRGLEFSKCYPKTKTVIVQKLYKGMIYTYWYKYTGGKLKQKAAKFDATGYTGSLSYEGSKGKAVSKASYSKRIAKLKKGKAKSLKSPWSWKCA